MKYFSIVELTRSVTATQKGINNTPPETAVKAMTELIDKVLDPVREAWGKPVSVNSGYRCALLNATIGSKETSQHLKGEAADINAGNRTENKKLFNLIQSLANKNVIEFDQLIDESDCQWIHISYTAERKNRGQVLKL